jgi:hypothetical protein
MVLAAFAALQSCGWIFPGDACAEINLFANLNYLSSASKTTDKTTGEFTDGRFSQFRQLYNLDLSKSLTPNLFFRSGGVFELDDQWSTTNGADTDAERKTVRPFVELNLSNPVYTVGAGYRKSEIRNSGSGIPETSNTREEYTALLGWRPVDLPVFSASYTLANVSNEPKTTDTTEDLLRLDAVYGVKGLSLNYAYSYDDLKNKLTEFSSLTQVHYGRVGYSRGFYDSRLSFNTLYTISYATTEFSGTGTDTPIPVSRSTGLFSLNNVPTGGPALDSSPALVDGVRTASAGIDIGLGGDQAVRANIGVDLGFPRNVDTVHLWVDRSLTSAVAGFFSWEIYTSPDNENGSSWSLHSTVFPAPFAIFQNRFEIRFPAVETRFIKVVTRALSPAVIGSSGFQNIFVTEMETFVTVAGQGGVKLTSAEHNYSLGVRWRLSDRTSVGYDLFYTLQEADPPPVRGTSLTNGIGVNHQFNSIFTGGARWQRADRKEAETESVTNNYTASLRAAYLPTFTQTLSYTGTFTEETLVNSTTESKTNSIYLRNVAQLYSGWSATADIGFSRNEPSQGTRANSTLARFMTTVVPNDKISFNLSYSATWTKELKAGVESRSRQQTLDLDAYIVPTRNFSLFSRISAIEEAGSTRLFQNYSANWSPFQGGGLQFSFAYNEVLRSEDNATEKTIGPGVRLDINRRVICEASYQWIRTDSDLTRADSEVFSSNVKLLF